MIILEKKAIMIKRKEAKGNRKMNEKALYKITYGLYVVSAEAEGKSSGCVVNTLQQVTSKPVTAFCGGQQG